MYFYNHDPESDNHDLDVVGDDDKMKCDSFVYHWSQIQEKQCKSGLCYISRWTKTKIFGQNIAKIGLNFRDSTSSI